MKSLNIKILSVVLIVLLVFSPVCTVYAIEQTVDPKAETVSVKNNAGISDTIEVSDLNAGDVVRIYPASTGGTILGYATVPTGKQSVNITIPQLSTDKGTIYYTLTNPGKSESNRIEVSYGAEEKTTTLSAGKITATNNYGTSDIVSVKEIAPGDIIRVYALETGGTMLGTSTVLAGKSEATIKITQLGESSDFIYVTITSKGNLESDRTKVSFSAEGPSQPISAANIDVVNNANISDLVTVKGLYTGDVVKVYEAVYGGTEIATATAAVGKSSVEMRVMQLGSGDGFIYVSLTGAGKMESERTTKGFSAEKNSAAPVVGNINIKNYAGTSDTIKISGLADNDLVKIYTDETGGTVIASAKAPIGKGYVEMKTTQLAGAGGSIYVSVTNTGRLESVRVKADYNPEGKTVVPGNISIIVNNYAALKDTIEVKNLHEGDLVKVYEAVYGGSPLGSGVYSTSKNAAIISVAQLGTVAGSVYASVTSTGYLESDRVGANYKAEDISKAPNPLKVDIQNNAGMQDVITVKERASGDVIRLYRSLTGTEMVGTGTVPTGKDTAVIKVNQLGTVAGSVYASAISTGDLESDRIAIDYIAEVPTTKLTGGVAVKNNSGSSDTVSVSLLASGDVIKVYTSETEGKQIGMGVVGASKSEIVINIPQLGVDAGTVYVSITKTGKLESVRFGVDYLAEVKTDALEETQISVANNAGIKDKITVTGLDPGDIVKVYPTNTAVAYIGSAIVEKEKNQVEVYVPQLDPEKDKVYVSVLSKGMLESDRTSGSYVAEAKSSELLPAAIEVANNMGIADTVTVSGLNPGDMIKVYAWDTGGTALSTATVAAGKTAAVASIVQLGNTAGKVYVSVTRVGLLESALRTDKAYAAEAKSDSPDVDKMLVINNTGSDIVIVYGLKSGDIVKVYKNNADVTEIGKASVASGQTQVVITVKQLGESGGDVYVSVMSIGKDESPKTKKAFSAE